MLPIAEAGDDAQTVECQVECARLLSSIAGRSSSLLLSGGALGTLEDMLERLGAEQRFAHVPPPSPTVLLAFECLWEGGVFPIFNSV